MRTVFSGQGLDEASPPPSRADEKMMEQTESRRLLAPSNPPRHEQTKPRSQPTRQKAQQRASASVSAQKHSPPAAQAHRQQPLPHQPWQPRVSLPSLSIFHPRSAEEIYAEQAYLSLTLQSHSRRLCDLVSTYHHVEAESTHGESRKIKRRARRQIGILRAQIKHAAEQEKIIHLRLSDLLIEAKSRAALDLARHHHHHPARHFPSRPSEPASASVSPSTCRLNGAIAEFKPDTTAKEKRDQRADSGVDVYPDSDDEHAPRFDDEHYALSPHTMAVPCSRHDTNAARPGPPSSSPLIPATPPPPRQDTPHLAAGYFKFDALMLRRQVSMPNIRTSFLV
ncbi:hypothetical protein E4U21_001841 [Claviceps maximensis]|nr:hypothetical protein E4U21_001841 [Claviceps maximensis]